MSEHPRFPWRGLVAALLLTPLSAYWAANQGMDIILSLMIPPVCLTFAVVLVNRGLDIIAPRCRFSQADLVVLYAFLSVATAMGAEWDDIFGPLIVSYALFAGPGNNFGKILSHLPPFLFARDARLLQDFKTGGKELPYILAHMHLWMGYILWWTLILFLLAFAMLCINSLMRLEWTRREKLSFPIIQLPIALTDGGGRGPIWRDRWFRGGFAVIFGVDMVNGLHFLYPTVPWLNIRFVGDVGAWTTASPWNSIGWTPIGLFPFATALGTFLPTDLLFSTLFFFVFRKLQQIFCGALGYPQGTFGGAYLTPSPPYLSEQTWGAFLGLFAMAVWVARGYLKELWNRIRDGSSPGQRWALAGLGVCLVGLAAIGQKAGLSAPGVALYIVVFLMFSVALTRMRAELGPPTHEMAFVGPNSLIVDSTGTRGLSAGTITVLAVLFHFINRTHRTDPMPGQLEAMKLGERSHLGPGVLFGVLALATAVGPLCGMLMRFGLWYRWGLNPWVAWEPSGVVSDLLNRPRDPNAAGDLFIVIGFLAVVGLNFLRYRLASFPLNPVGYALAMNFGVDYYWAGLVVALLLKLGVQRYAGLRGYHKLHALALGVILGEYGSEAIWAGIAMVYHIATYSVSINGRLGWNV